MQRRPFPFGLGSLSRNWEPSWFAFGLLFGFQDWFASPFFSNIPLQSGFLSGHSKLGTRVDVLVVSTPMVSFRFLSPFRLETKIQAVGGVAEAGGRRQGLGAARGAAAGGCGAGAGAQGFPGLGGVGRGVVWVG